MAGWPDPKKRLIKEVWKSLSLVTYSISHGVLCRNDKRSGPATHRDRHLAGHKTRIARPKSSRSSVVGDISGKHDIFEANHTSLTGPPHPPTEVRKVVTDTVYFLWCP